MLVQGAPGPDRTPDFSTYPLIRAFNALIYRFCEVSGNDFPLFSTSLLMVEVSFNILALI